MTARPWEVELMFVVLGAKQAQPATNGPRHYKRQVEALKGGDVYEVAKAVRNLAMRNKDEGLSAAEKRMLDHGRRILISEVTTVLGVDDQTARRRLDQALG